MKYFRIIIIVKNGEIFRSGYHIKEQTTSVYALHQAFDTAFDTAIMSAETQRDFIEIKKAIEQAGMSSLIASEQMQILNAGIKQGSDGASEMIEKLTEQNQLLEENTTETKENTQSKQEHVQKSREQAQATEQATQAEQRHASALTITAGKYAMGTANMREQIVNLKQYGVALEKISELTSSMYKPVDGMRGGFTALSNAIANINTALQQQVNHFKHSRENAINMTQALSKA